MSQSYVHGYQPRENDRLRDQAGTLVELLHGDTAYPPGSTVLEVGCAACGAMATGGPEVTTSPASAVPHSPQNLVPGALGVPHAGQAALRRAPHSPQNLRPGSLGVPQLAQFTVGPRSVRQL